MNPKILIIDTYYPDFLKSLPFDSSSIYDVELRKVLDRKFGTADAYSSNLRKLGWDAVDVVYNHESLQEMWMRERDIKIDVRPIIRQIEHYDPDVVFLQDLSIPLHTPRMIAAQCSCPWPGDDAIRRCDVVFTSFPHYVPRIEALSVRAIYNPLAFEPSVLEHARPKCSDREAGIQSTHAADMMSVDAPARINDVVFVGGVGAPSHWRYGMQVLETVAREIPTFKWWGYGVPSLPADSALRSKYQGEAYGLDMYEILLQSKICLNRHGEVAEGYANNMRCFEAGGCAALLLTETAPNLHELLPPGTVASYVSPADAVTQINYYLSHDEERAAIANEGQAHILRNHTYEIRMKTVSDVLTACLKNENEYTSQR